MVMEGNNSLFKILIVDDEADYRETSKMLLEEFGYQVETAESGEEALKILEIEYYPLIITDIMMSGLNGIGFLQKVKSIYQQNVEVIMVTGYGSVETAVQTMKIGAFGYFIKSHNPDELILEIEKAKEVIDLKTLNNLHRESRENKFLVASKNKNMQKVWELVDKVAESNANILIIGESGVGKEIIANEIHVRSPRKIKPFVPINCQHYPDKLIESELFGHEKGAFTGAVARRLGKLEETNGGTIFLDEIGEMDLGTQVKLLRVLENHAIERIGSNRSITVDFRLVSATNRDIYAAVEEGLFRKDFLYRINTIEIDVPALRERPEDIEDLIDFFIERFAKQTGKYIIDMEPESKEILLKYQYPGNVRELKNIIERMVILSSGGMLTLDNKKAYVSENICNVQTINSVKTNLSYKEAKQEFEKQYIKGVIEACGGNITHAAEKMGMSRRQLFNKITEYGIKNSQ
ncbi:sigma-54-dependent transcriptional regulator [Aminipila sp.]|uniref:sigma-54-dependent transcriptional regulator n=1 Tax=Aminipila sp. TaxID=2060095 RepID=UPI00289BF886|nr:sigma-54 dependent transcriptional regulator [Aminipila sp.]